MKTRTYTVIEAVAIWFLVVASLGVAVYIYMYHNGIYTAQKIKIEEENDKIQNEMNNLDREITAQKKELKILERKVKQKQKKDEKDKEDLDKKFAKLEKTIVNLPYYEYWPDLITKIERLAEQKIVYISNFTMVDQQELKSKRTTDVFTEKIFVLDIEGEYSRIMEYIWNLENAIYLTGMGGNERWRAVVKVVDGGFSIQTLNTEDMTMKLRLQLMTFFRKGQKK